MNIECGVPQGSILGPILFILYINDICNVSDLVSFVLFADDTNMFCSDSNINSLCRRVCNELQKLKVWFMINKLSLNINKTNFMLFTNRKVSDNIMLKIDNHVIERVYSTKFMGVIIDSKLHWKDHIKRVKSEISKSIAILHKVKDILDVDSMKLLYSSLVFPYINYCIEVWGNTFKSNIHPIYVLEKKALRIIYKTKFNEHTNKLFIHMQALKLNDLIDYKTAIIMYRAKRRSLPTNLQNLFTCKANAYYFTRQSENFQYNFARTSLKNLCVSIYGVKLWNSLSDALKECKNEPNFKKCFKLEKMNEYRKIQD